MSEKDQKKASSRNRMYLHAGHRKRLRTRALTDSWDHFEEHQVLELLLFLVIPRKDTNELAHRLLARFGTFSNVLNAPSEALCEVNGISHTAAEMLSLIRHFFVYYEKSRLNKNIRLSTVEMVGRYMQQTFPDLSAEFVSVVALSDELVPLDVKTFTDGLYSRVSVTPESIFGEGFAPSRSKLILAHNHPSGCALPSDADVDATLSLSAQMRSRGGEVLDHIVFDDHLDYVSFAQSGLLQNGPTTLPSERTFLREDGSFDPDSPTGKIAMQRQRLAEELGLDGFEPVSFCATDPDTDKNVTKKQKNRKKTK